MIDGKLPFRWSLWTFYLHASEDSTRAMLCKLFHAALSFPFPLWPTSFLTHREKHAQ
jgi:hypothetical protein